MRADRRSDGHLLATLPWTLAAVGLATVPHIGTLAPWILLLALVCGVWRILVEVRRGRLPWRGIRVALAMGGFLAVLFTYGGINGVGPGTALLVIMASLKLLETRTLRDQFVLLFIALFLVLSGFLREQHMWSLPYLFASLFLIVMAWVNVARGGTALGPAASAATAGRLLAHALPLMLACWMLFPRVPGPFWAIPTNQGEATTGLTDRMSPGDITRLGESDALAFRVEFDGAVPRPADRYWRGLVMDQVLDGRTWAVSERRYTHRAEDAITSRGTAVSYRVTLEPTSQRYLFALELPKIWDLPESYMTSAYELRREKPINERITYSAVSLPLATAGRRLTDRGRDYLTRLPPDTNPRTAELAATLRAGSEDDEAYIENVLDFYRRGDFRYTLSPPGLGRNASDEFLFDTRRGFCEHFATSFATLMRAGGIPARAVAGYQGGERNPFGSHYILRQSDAHAWTEVWLDGRGWVRIDPTAIVAPERIESGLLDALAETEIGATDRLWRMDLVESLRMYWDLVDTYWNKWVLGFGPETQRDFLRWLGMDDPDWESMVTLLVILMAALLGLLTVWLALQYRRPRPDPAERLYRRFVKRVGLERGPAEAPLSYADRAAAALPGCGGEIGRITALYLGTRYAGEPRLDELATAVRRFVPARLRGAGPRHGKGRRRPR